MITLGRKCHYFPETLSLDSRTVVDSSFMISFARTQELFGFWRVPAYARGICKNYCPYCPTVHHCCLRYFHIDKDFLFLGRRYEETGRQENFRTTNMPCGSITKPIRLVYNLTGGQARCDVLTPSNLLHQTSYFRHLTSSFLHLTSHFPEKASPSYLSPL